MICHLLKDKYSNISFVYETNENNDDYYTISFRNLAKKEKIFDFLKYFIPNFNEEILNQELGGQ